MAKNSKTWQSAQYYLFSNWKRIMPEDLKIVKTIGRGICAVATEANDFGEFCVEHLRLESKGNVMGYFEWHCVNLTYSDIRKFKKLEFDELYKLLFRLDLCPLEYTRGFQVLPKNFCANTIRSFFKERLPKVFKSSYERYNYNREYTVNIEGIPTTTSEIDRLGKLIGRIPSLRDRLV